MIMQDASFNNEMLEALVGMDGGADTGLQARRSVNRARRKVQ